MVTAEPTPTIFLHIGPMKTGTTYLQRLMADHQEALRSQGLLFPARIEQSRGVRDVMGLHLEDDTSGEFDGAWASLRDKMFAYQGRASLVSHEFLSFAHKPRAKAIISSLHPATVNVVLTVRDASRVLPSAWATATRNRSTASWQEYVAALLAGPDAAGDQWRKSMRAVDVPRMLKTWRRLVASDRLHVVIVPPPGAPPHLLWERFAKVLAVDPNRFDGAIGRLGESYGYYSADLMRRINTHLLHLPKPVYHRVRKHLLDEVLDKRVGEPKVPITRAVAEFAERWNAVTVEAIRNCDARVYGDVAELERAGGDTVEVAELPSAQELLPVAADAMSGLLRRRGMPGVTPERWSGEADPVAAAVRDVAAALSMSEDLPS